MSTNKIVIQTAEEFMDDYVPQNDPIYPVLLGNAQAHPLEVGKTEFKRLEAVGDLYAKRIMPKSTGFAEVNVLETKKTFKRYFDANRFTQSELQDQRGIAGIAAQVLDAHQVQMDARVLFGEGTSNGDVVNNGLYWSGDTNHTTESSVIVDVSNKLPSFHEKVMTTVRKSKAVAGKKLVLFYGASVLEMFDGIYASAAKAFKATLAETLPGVSFAEMPTIVTPNGVNGWIVVNLNQIKFHYTVLPKLYKQGVNEEMGYSWHHFLNGSCMVDVLAKNGVIKQPCTIDTVP